MVPLVHMKSKALNITNQLHNTSTCIESIKNVQDDDVDLLWSL